MSQPPNSRHFSDDYCKHRQEVTFVYILEDIFFKNVNVRTVGKHGGSLTSDGSWYFVDFSESFHCLSFSASLCPAQRPHEQRKLTQPMMGNYGCDLVNSPIKLRLQKGGGSPQWEQWKSHWNWTADFFFLFFFLQQQAAWRDECGVTLHFGVRICRFSAHGTTAAASFGIWLSVINRWYLKRI